ncbi:hypothetical protein QTP88_012559 [Uroleucon formosanum]
MINLIIINYYHLSCFFNPIHVFHGEELGLGRAIFGYKDSPETLLLTCIYKKNMLQLMCNLWSILTLPTILTVLETKLFKTKQISNKLNYDGGNKEYKIFIIENVLIPQD